MIIHYLDDASAYKKLGKTLFEYIHEKTKIWKSFYTSTINVSQNLSKTFWIKNLLKLVIFMACVKFISLKS